MLSSGDMANIRAAFGEMRTDNAVSIALRRGSTTLAAQSFRFALTGGATRNVATTRPAQGASESTAQGTLVGAITADVQIGDRFTSGGVVWRVIYVRPDRRAATLCDVEATA
jgi:hypothetical protein